MKVHRGRKIHDPKGKAYERDWMWFRDRDGDKVLVTSGPNADGAEVLVVELADGPPIMLSKRNVKALLPHWQAWLETSSLRVGATQTGGAP